MGRQVVFTVESGPLAAIPLGVRPDSMTPSAMFCTEVVSRYLVLYEVALIFLGK